MNRRMFLRCAAAGMGFGAMSSIYSSEVRKPQSPYKVLWNDDTTNIPGYNRDAVMTDEKLYAAIDSVLDMGIDAYVLAPGYGWIPWWKSSEYPDHYQWRLSHGVQPDCFGRYMLAGGDLVAALISHCRKRNIAPLVSYRLNDCHHQENRRSPLVCRFYEDHPEYLLDPQHYQKKGYYAQRGQNWAFPEVRAYKLSLIGELCRTYDIDGIELDFLRDDHLFKEHETTETERVAWITDFVRSVREALDEGSVDGRRRYLCVRIPCEIAAHGRSGIDVERFAGAGVDIFNLSNWYHTAQRTDTAAVRALAPTSAIFVEMHPVTTNRSGSGYDTASFPKASNEQLWTTAHLAYERGADGVSFFNMQYNRKSYRALAHMSDRAWLAAQPQYYFLGKVPYLRQVPAALQPGIPHTFMFDMAPPDRFQNIKLRLRIHAYTPLTGHAFAVTINGCPLAPCDDTGAFLGSPYDQMYSDRDGRAAFAADDAYINNGLNNVVVTAATGTAITIENIDILLENGV